MSPSFASYSEISTRALQFNPKAQDVIYKKAEILSSIQDHHNTTPNSVLFCGFNPIILSAQFKEIFVCNITEDIKKYLDYNNIKYTYIPATELRNYKKTVDWTIAGDEYFTFAESEEQQKNNVEELINVTKSTLITTLKDYKNFDYKDREFSYPLAVHNGKESMVFLEYHDMQDKNSWNTTVYEIQGDSVAVSGPYARCSMFFKQLAKFSIDSGAKNFYVHKNLMYKSVIKKNYEHVISINL